MLTFPPDPVSGRDRPRARWSRGRKIAVVVALILFFLGGASLLLTDARPRVTQPPPPTAEQVGAARAAARQLDDDLAPAGTRTISLDAVQVAAAAALLSDGFQPHRLSAAIRGGGIAITGSYRLPLGRWLNVTAVSRGGGTDFPPVRLTVGSVAMSPRISRSFLELGRRFAISRGAQLPPLDRLVRAVTVDRNSVRATVSLPPGNAALAWLGADATRISPDAVRYAYCRLVRMQTAHPSADFATQVRRTFAAAPGGAGSPASNRVGFVALAMLTVDVRVGELAGLAPAMTTGFPAVPVTLLLNGRADSPKHWALSAGLAAVSGTRFSEAMGEWKELADGLSKQSQFAVGDPSGFSLLDLATDRSGLLIAGLATEPDLAARLTVSLARAGSEDLLPKTLMNLPDGMSNQAFARRYGSTDDPRFLAVLARIDAELRRSAMARGGPLSALPLQ